MSKKTPAEVAAERYQMPQEANSGFDWYDDECDKVRRKRQGYAGCYTERTLPLLDRIEEYAAAVEQMLAHEQSGGDGWWKGFEMLKAAHAKATQ